MLTRRSLVAAGLLAPVAARAQSSAGNIVRIVNPFAAGGTSDAMARLLQPSLQQRLGATIIIENRPGASASIGATVVAKSPPDGTTWLLTSDTFVVSTLLLGNPPYDVQKDFEPVTMIARGPMVLCAHPSRPFKTLPDLVAAAKARPGVLTYGTTGIGSNGHLTMAALGQLADMKLVHVPYRGAAPVLNDGTAGHVDMVISSSATMAPQIESGQLHPATVGLDFSPAPRPRSSRDSRACTPIRGSASSARPARRSRSSTASIATLPPRCARRRTTTPSSPNSAPRWCCRRRTNCAR